jgi:hypothetical protein
MNGFSKTRNPFLGTMAILIESAAPLAISGLLLAIAVAALSPSSSSVQVKKVGMVFQIIYNTCLVSYSDFKVLI